MANYLQLSNGERINSEDDICLSLRFVLSDEQAKTPGDVSWFRVRRSKTKKYYVEVKNPNFKEGKGCFLDTLSSWTEFYDVLLDLLEVCVSADYVMGDEQQYDSLRLTFPSSAYIEQKFDGEWMEKCKDFRLDLTDEEKRKQYYND